MIRLSGVKVIVLVVGMDYVVKRESLEGVNVVYLNETGVVLLLPLTCSGYDLPGDLHHVSRGRLDLKFQQHWKL